MDNITLSYITDLVLHDVNNPFGSGIFTTIDSIKGLERPQIRTSTMNRPGGHGAILSNQLYGGRLITMEGQIYSPSLNVFQTVRRAMLEAFKIDKDQYGAPILKELKFTTRDGGLYSVMVVVQDFTLGQQKYNYVPFQVQFFAPDSAIYSQSETTYFLEAQISGGAVYPVLYPVVYSPSSGGRVTVPNAGSIEMLPRLYLSGNLSAPIITNVTTGKYIAIGEIMETGDIMEIDMANQTILLNGTNSLSSRILGSEWWGLYPGDNLLQLTTSDSGDDGQVSIIFRDAYVGI